MNAVQQAIFLHEENLRQVSLALVDAAYLHEELPLPSMPPQVKEYFALLASHNILIKAAVAPAQP
jgi:hypothetical protein